MDSNETQKIWVPMDERDEFEGEVCIYGMKKAWHLPSYHLSKYEMQGSELEFYIEKIFLMAEPCLQIKLRL